MAVINGRGYNSLIDAYSKGKIPSGYEISVHFKTRFLDLYSPPSNFILFDRRGALRFVLDGRISRVLRLDDLVRIREWRIPATTHEERTPFVLPLVEGEEELIPLF